MKLSELAEASVSRIERGDAEMEIIGAAGLDIACPGDITFLANPKYTPQIRDTNASAIFLNDGVRLDRNDIAVLRSKDAYLAYTRALRLFYPATEITAEVHASAVIDETASISSNCEIGANVVIGKHCRIADG